MKREVIKEFLIGMAEVFFGIEKDEIELDTDVEYLEVARVVNHLMFAQWPIDILNVSLLDGTAFTIYGEEFRKSTDKEDGIGAEQFVKLAIVRARQDKENRPNCFRKQSLDPCSVLSCSPNSNN